MRIAAGLILAVLLIGMSSPASANGPKVGKDSGVIDYKNEKQTPARDATAQSKARQVKRAGTHKPTLYYGVVAYGTNGWCVKRAQTTDPKVQERNQQQFGFLIESLVQQGKTFDPACLSPATLKSVNPQTMSRGQAVDLFWATQVTLPNPTPQVTPDIAITGLRTHLTITGAGPTTFTLPDPLSPEPIVIEALPVYEVSWGDGNVDTTSATGGPASDLYNVYRDLGYYNITVTAHWEATWKVGNTGAVEGQLSGLATTGQIPRFQVDEIQAVEQPNPIN